MPLIRPPVLPVWADTGDKTQPSDAEIAVGWPVTSIPPSRQRFNWFFNWAGNAVRYFSRRGVPDWIATESYEIYDIQRSLVDGKTYRSLVTANINFEPSANPLKWERWGFSLSELWAYISSGLYGGACPNTGPASAPTLANPYLEYTSALGEIWRYVGGVWKVIANCYKLADTAYTTANGNQTVTIFTYTAHRAGTIAAHFYVSALSASSTTGLVQVAIYKNGAVPRYATTTRAPLNDGMDSTTSAVHTVAAGDVITFVTTGASCGQMSSMHSLAYID